MFIFTSPSISMTAYDSGIGRTTAKDDTSPDSRRRLLSISNPWFLEACTRGHEASTRTLLLGAGTRPAVALLLRRSEGGEVGLGRDGGG
uniref:Uncharacterized protein n=1 Tax=Arundo donax TaxID=35708 RepID=A0A0A9DQH1_ARUDO